MTSQSTHAPVPARVTIASPTRTVHTRIEWPSLSTSLMSKLRSLKSNPTTPSRAQKTEALAMLRAEIELIDLDMGIEPWIAESWVPKSDHDLSNLVKSLYYRNRLQSAFLSIFEILYEKRMIDAKESLRLPIIPTTTSDPTVNVGDWLGCFEGLASERALEMGKQEDLPFGLWGWEFCFEAEDWLCTMIIRGCLLTLPGGELDMPALVEVIEESSYLGKLNRNKLAEVRKEHEKRSVKIVKNMEQRADEEVIPGYFGFWLPHGVEVDDEDGLSELVGKCRGRCKKAEKGFRAFFDVPETETL